MEKITAGRKLTKNEILLICIGAVLLVIFIVLISWGIHSKHRTDGTSVPQAVVMPDDANVLIRKEFSKLNTIEKTVKTGVIKESLKDMGFLVTQEYFFTEVTSFSKIKKLLKTDIALKFTETSYMATYEGSVTAGLDCTKIDIKSDDSKKIIYVSLPKAEIKNVDIDPDTFQLVSEKQGIGNPLTASDFNTSLTELENTARKKALDSKILDRADENARVLISGFIRSLIENEDYSIQYSVK